MESTNKIALITGGSRGLGKNTAKHIASKGIDVIITYRSKKEEAEAVVAEIEESGQKAAALQLDTSDTKSFDSFFENLKALLNEKWSTDQFNFLINNAGIDRAAPFAQTTEENFDELFNVHFKGVFFLTQKALPFIADGGRIINLSTGLARFSTPGYIAYASMKGAIEVFTRYLAKELGSRGITANAVAPGITRTDFTQHALSHPGLEEMMNKSTALGRVGEPDDIGGVIAFLCTDDARWITAQRIEASGGMFL
jgi:NAD(P)-dependent dehydrogenase (short-subunit alcohol dehydrogenase family)